MIVIQEAWSAVCQGDIVMKRNKFVEEYNKERIKFDEKHNKERTKFVEQYDKVCTKFVSLSVRHGAQQV